MMEGALLVALLASSVMAEWITDRVREWPREREGRVGRGRGSM